MRKFKKLISGDILYKLKCCLVYIDFNIAGGGVFYFQKINLDPKAARHQRENLWEEPSIFHRKGVQI